jgi:hypothetical protein
MWPLASVLASGLIAIGSATAQNVSVPPQSLIINEQIAKAWKDNKLTPAARASDDVFVRRVFIDIIGRIPTAEEVRDFERDKSANKRAKLIHRLLHDEAYKIKGDDGKTIVFEYAREYAEHWADIWTVWLMTRGGTNEVYHNGMKFWLEKAFAKNMPHDEMVRSLLTATGRTNDNGAVNFIMAHLGDASPPDRRLSDGPFDSIPITSRVTRLFLGVQTQCTQCHDHPFNPEWGQENFWGVNAFFRTTTRDRDPAPAAGMGKKKMPDALPVTITDEPRSLNPGMRIYYERRTGVLMSIKPTFLPNLADLEKDKSERPKKVLPAEGAKSRREVLADYVTAHDNFGKAFVNRMWAHFFGRGMNEQPAPDDFGGHNKVIHPALLEELGKEFVKYKYDPKMVIEWICNSEPYNLSYVAPTKDVAKAESDVFFARMPLKAQSPEVLFESLTTATKADAQVDKDARKSARDAWMQKLVRNFGDDEGNEMTFNGTIVQALLMMNGKELNDEIRRADGVVAKAVTKAMKMGAGRDQWLIDEIYLTALARRPSSTTIIDIEHIDPKTKRKTVTKTTEAAFVMSQLQLAKGHPVGKKLDDRSVYQTFGEDLFWSLLNTNEFMLNH